MSAVPDSPAPVDLPQSPLERLAADTLVSERGAVVLGVFDPKSAEVVAVGGDADGVPMEPERPWPTASLSKVFVAAAVLRLVDQGLIDLDAPIGDYVDFAVPPEVTARLALLHQAAIPEVDFESWTCTSDANVAEVEEAAGRAGELWAPGEHITYSNTGYMVLGRLIESVTGADPGEHMRDTIFAPLGMDSTYFYESQEGPWPWWPRPRQAAGQGMFECGVLGPTVGVDGAAITSAADMDAFYRTLFEGGLVSDSSLELMTTPASKVFGYPLGLGLAQIPVDDTGDTLAFGFGGDGGSFLTLAVFDPVASRTVVVFTTEGDTFGVVRDAYATGGGP
ncbi:serine hydrolase [Demequina sp. NBRC 110056]|uniref:serine hydrolase domain-containing protein n=1 Tax=Demequina sp. NBRC 110056 TaxID=1570345 RepID=UPI0013563AFF|nr:serine hydrolase domain-containing protein [Demequina sp. NBRC 110056]